MPFPVRSGRRPPPVSSAESSYFAAGNLTVSAEQAETDQPGLVDESEVAALRAGQEARINIGHVVAVVRRRGWCRWLLVVRLRLPFNARCADRANDVGLRG